ncbi:MAG TPA: type VI secretion protein IcmF/TssM N-terminal domain-containing protein [Gemmataceae bacterium]|nr:type VI secretion protein IcmF/TssM N-terminal domain-containing protein [Gemmataceae bacterium]
MMLALFRLLGRGLKGLAASLGLVFARVRDWRKYSLRLRWPLHFLMVALILACLAVLNYYLDLERILRTPWPILRRVWLPLLFLLIYANAWLGRWLWQLLGPEKGLSEFPDLDDAWNKAMQTLDRAGIELSSVPLFLVLGRPRGPESALFHAARLEFSVQQAPSVAAPLHVWANSTGIWVTCPEASLLGRHAVLLSPLVGPASRAGQEQVPLGSRHLPAVGPASRAGLGEVPLGSRHLPVVGPASRAGQEQVPLGSRHLPAVEGAEPALESGERIAAGGSFLLKNTAESEELSARLRHLCQLIVRDRLPYCPLNGVLLLLPLAATADETIANQTGGICERDLQTVEEVLQVQCPLMALVCDVEQAPGFRDFIARFPEENRGRRLGRGFSYLIEVDRPSLPRMIENGVEWIGEGLMPPLMYRLLHLGKGNEDRASALQGNRRLYQFLDDLRQRQPSLARLLLRAAVRPDSAVWLSGCYLAATGAAPDNEQAFVADVFRQMIDSQNFVSWTSQALTEERAYRRLVQFGYVCLGLFTLAVLALGLTL